MYFDAHVHLGKKEFFKGINAGNQNPLAVEALPDSQWEKYTKLAEKKSVFKALAMPYPMAQLNTETVNAYVSEAFQKNRELFIPFWRISNTITEDDVKKNYIQASKNILL